MTKKKKFSEKELLEDLAALLEHIADNISSFIGPEAGYAVLGYPPLPPNSEMTDYPNKVDAAILAKLSITDCMLRAYDYVMNARWPTGNDIPEPLEEVAQFMEFWDRLTPEDSYCRYVHDAAFARWAIDEPWEEMNLDFGQIALLAEVDERTVRNAASGKGPNQLLTIKVGSKTLVRPEDALAWLKTRPSFRPTVFYTSRGHESFSNAEEFGQFLVMAREELGLDRGQLLQRLGWPEEKGGYLADLEHGLSPCRLEEVIPLAKALNKSEESFLRRFMEVFYPREWQILTTAKAGG
jgi:hypothetical protein